MKVTLLSKPANIYTCNAYLVRGDWNALADVNTLIDVGTDGFILDELLEISTGVGKRRVEQVILTHEHFDHAGGLKKIREAYQPRVYAYSKIAGVDTIVNDGMKLRVGDREAEILYTPGHSHDSICIYISEDGVLFSGDTQLNIKSPGGSYGREYVAVLERLMSLDINTIYSGHDHPFHGDVRSMLAETLSNVRKSRVK